MGTLMAYHWRQMQLFALTDDHGYKRRIEHQGEHTINIPCWRGETLDWLVVCTKAGATLDALAPYQTQLPHVDRLVLLQNGMGQQQQLENWLRTIHQAPSLWVASTTEGAYRRDQHTVVYAGIGETLAGPWSNDDDDAPLPPTWQRIPDIRTRLFHKLAVNAVINPLTAQHHCKNGELLTEPFRAQAEALCHEVEAAFAQFNWPCPQPLWQTIIQVASATANNRSSSLQDIEAGRPTELAYITGHIMAQARRHKLSLPLQQTLLSTIENDRIN